MRVGGLTTAWPSHHTHKCLCARVRLRVYVCMLYVCVPMCACLSVWLSWQETFWDHSRCLRCGGKNYLREGRDGWVKGARRRSEGCCCSLSIDVRGVEHSNTDAKKNNQIMHWCDFSFRQLRPLLQSVRYEWLKCSVVRLPHCYPNFVWWSIWFSLYPQKNTDFKAALKRSETFL